MEPNDLAPGSARLMTRREALRRAGLATLGLALTPMPAWAAARSAADEVVIPFTDIPTGFTGRRPGEERFPGQNRFAQDLRELTSWTTPIEDFFVVAHYDIPELEAAEYRLEISGLLARPLRLSLDDLRALPRVERTIVFECGGNASGMLHGMVGNATWAGAELSALLERVGPAPEAREVHFWGADAGPEEIRGAEYSQNFGRSMSLAEVLAAGPILAYEMNGAPLPVVHGFPVRLIVPGWYGVAQVKWLQRIELSADRLMTRFMARDYVTLMGHEREGGVEWVETSVTRQRVKSVIARVSRVEDRFRIFGAAWSDTTPIERVEIRIDDAPWRDATLERRDGPESWTFFTLEVPALAPGTHTLTSRATDARGRTQPSSLDLKKTRWENNELFPRTIQVG